MKIRNSFAAAFLVLCALSAYLGFADIHLGYDKALHAITFFILTLVFYWTIDSSRKKSINLTFLVCTVFLGIGSEFAQNFSPYREFDFKDILYNAAGSISAIALSAWYHKRLLSRKRSAKYHALHQVDTPHQRLGQVTETGEEIDLEAQTAPSTLRAQPERVVEDDASAITLQEVAPEPVSASVSTAEAVSK
ncbi:uncharacterized protein SAPINGB_P003251 [Magnusiomyces paraingens]|uniref:VanZ-like domain-containing protein n=1 Tax=Magnusiomyces paraingens TaxID=2606893 RepID=A0A5E8BJZ4_9ASCO|nr:uncharacterized protein SAPINGB_P003251 [Saprochaete ingens]VVT51902.1 unnamed protein product [Saprochaete ingens]